MIVEIVNNEVAGMATVNFSVPDDVRDEFNRVFKGENKSAIIARLMRRAVAEVRLQKQREAIFRQITAERPKRPTVSEAEIAAARRQGRP
jgi:metal-responsive CopG/Arc/MetJ family transcriptional regulator